MIKARVTIDPKVVKEIKLRIQADTVIWMYQIKKELEEKIRKELYG